MKYLTQDTLKQYDTALKEHIDNIFTSDLTSYGVSWKPNVGDPHLTRVGNMTYHKSLPIQNNMKGCIAQMKDGAKIIYYLNHNDWRFKEHPDYLYNKQVIDNTITDDVFKDLKYEHQYVKINNTVLQVKSINTETKTATIEAIESGTYDIELGSCTNGYDGEVMVEVPEFWIKSWDTDTRREVRITPTYIDDSWEHQPHILVAAYHDTVLNTVPNNMGYLSQLEVNSAISVANTHDYCRGGNNDTTYDQYLETDRFRTLLGKPRTNISRDNMRTYCRKAGKEIISYLQYKRIMYWLYVIEYANFNCQEEFNEALTKEGFKQGGLGNGILSSLNNNLPVTPNGYTNEIGNKSNIKLIVLSIINNNTTSFLSQYVPRWHGIENPFGDIWNNVDGILINSSSIVENDKKYSEFYATDDAQLYSDWNYSKMKMIGIACFAPGYIKEWNLSSTAEIIPRSTLGTKTTYKCDSYWCDLVGLRLLFLGGHANSNKGGLGNSHCDSPVHSTANMVGFRSSCIIK